MASTSFFCNPEGQRKQTRTPWLSHGEGIVPQPLGRMNQTADRFYRRHDGLTTENAEKYERNRIEGIRPRQGEIREPSGANDRARRKAKSGNSLSLNTSLEHSGWITDYLKVSRAGLESRQLGRGRPSVLLLVRAKSPMRSSRQRFVLICRPVSGDLITE
jgi:hypothetical protein